MKIAVYIVGQWRGTSYQCSENLKKIFDKFDTDYYINIWPFYEGKIINHINHDDTPGKQCIVECENYNHTETDFENIKNTYKNVVSFEIESYDMVKDIKNLQSTFYQYYCAYKANEIRKTYEINNNIKYDVIVKIRPDLIFGELDIENMIKRIEYVKDNQLSVFSWNYIPAYALIENTNLVWDFYTISSTFGMDCMAQWISDIIHKGNTPERFSSNYVIENKLIVNPNVASLRGNTFPYIMREMFKHNNLIDDFFNEINSNRNNSLNKLFSLWAIDQYLYHFNTNNNEYIGEYLKINDDDIIKETNSIRGIFDKEKHMFLTEHGLKQLADLIKNKVNENNIHAKDN